MCSRVFAIVVVIIAVLLAFFASILPQNQLTGIVYFSRFFDIMLPILAVGALIKYLFCFKQGRCDKVTLPKE